MKKTLLTLTLITLNIIGATAQYSGSGYYRLYNYGIQSKASKTAYCWVSYNYLKINKQALGSQDVEALALYDKNVASPVSAPSTVVYISNTGTYSSGKTVDLEAQGAKVSSITGTTLKLYQNSNNTYSLYGTGTYEGTGYTIWLYSSTAQKSGHYIASSISKNKADAYKQWVLEPITSDGDNYFGITPTLEVNGKYYQPFYASFPFKFASSGMKAYYVSAITTSSYTLTEITAETKPGKTPMLIECSSKDPSNNRLELLYGVGTSVASKNKLKGTYFCNDFVSGQYVGSTPNRVTFDASTMRVWNVENGKLVLSTATDNLHTSYYYDEEAPDPEDLKNGYINANTSYLVVDAAGGYATTLTEASAAASYTITFNTDGGSAVAKMTVKEGATIVPPANPTKTGYAFAGWSPALPSTMPGQNLTVTAQWTANKHNIVYKVDGEVYQTVSDVAYGTAITPIAAPTKTGYTFSGWSSVPATMPDNDVEVTGTFAVNQYTISFNTDGGSAVAAITQDYGTAITAPANPTKTGFTFAAWSPALPKTMPAKNQTVTAQWTVNKHSIVYKVDGEVYQTVGDVAYGTAITPIATPTKTGYTFSGWSSVPATMPDNDVTVTGTFAVNQYTITFDTDGGSAVASITQNYGTKVTAPADPTKDGFDFTGWSPSLPATMPASNVTVKAQWTEKKVEPSTYTITFNTDGGSEIESMTVESGAPITAPEAPTKTGYTFAGWSPALPATMPGQNLTVTAQWTANKHNIVYKVDGEVYQTVSDVAYGTAITPIATPTKTGYTFSGWSSVPATMPDNDVEVTGTFAVNQYTITFDTDGGSAVASITQDYGTAITAPADPDKTGFDFAGWTPALPATMPASNVTVKAQWTEKEALLGDVNGDWKVDAKDVDALKQHILGSTPDGFNEKVADINKDGKITGTDLVGLTDIILTGK